MNWGCMTLRYQRTTRNSDADKINGINAVVVHQQMELVQKQLWAQQEVI